MWTDRTTAEIAETAEKGFCSGAAAVGRRPRRGSSFLCVLCVLCGCLLPPSAAAQAVQPKGQSTIVLNGNSHLRTTGNVDLLVGDGAGGNVSMTASTTKLTIARHLTIASGSGLTVSPAQAASVTLGGNWSNGGAFTAGNSIVTMTGGPAATIGGAVLTPFYDLAIAVGGSTTMNVSTDVRNNLTASGTLALANGIVLRLGSGTASGTAVFSGTFRTTSGAAGKPTLTVLDTSFRSTVQVIGTCDVNGLNFSYGDSNGLHLTATATIANLRNVAFTNASTAASSAHVRVDIPGVIVLCPNCSFDAATAGGTPYNVKATGGGTFLQFMTLNGGAGASESYDSDDDNAPQNGVADGAGAVVDWVRTGSDAYAGAPTGFPRLAFDWNTGAYYSTYAIFKDTGGAGSADRVYALDSNGAVKYSFDVPQANGDIVGSAWFTTESLAHVVYFGTSAGYLYRLVDNGANLTATAGWPFQPVNEVDTDPSVGSPISEVTSEVRADGTNIYFGAVFGGTPKIFKVATATRLTKYAKTVPAQMTTRLDGWVTGGLTYLFGSTSLSGPNAYIYRTDDQSGSPVSSRSEPTADVVAPPFMWVAPGRIYVGDTAGTMHGMTAASAGFDLITASWPFSGGTGAIRGRATSNFVTPPQKVIWGTMSGELCCLDASVDPPAFIAPYPVTLDGGSAMEYQGYWLLTRYYQGNNNGKVLVVNFPTGALLREYSLGAAGVKVGDIVRDWVNNTLIATTSTGRIYYLTPTP